MSDPSTVLSPPSGSRIQVAEAGGGRLVLYIPEGGKRSRTIGIFALMWNGIIGTVTLGFILAGGKGDAPWYLLIPFLGLFWIIGFGFFYWWVKMRFTRTIVLVEPNRIVIQRSLFGRKSIRETELKEDSSARLIEAYKENDTPVYCVAVEGADRTAKFGTCLSREEKEWLVELINRFFGVAPAVAGEDSDRYPASDEVPVGQSPFDLPPESLITLEENHAGHLRFHYPTFPDRRILKRILGFVTFFAMVWIGIVVSVNVSGGGPDPAFRAVFLAFFVVLALIGLVPVFLVYAVMNSRITVDLTSERLLGRWHFGRLGVKKALPTDAITRVALTNRLDRPDRRGKNVIRAGGRSARKLKICTVFAGKEFLPLTAFHDLGTAREVAALLIGRLREMGITLNDA